MNIINVFIKVTFDQFDASLQNKSISLCLQKKVKIQILLTPDLRYFLFNFFIKVENETKLH